jgi:hypothetical protein
VYGVPPGPDLRRAVDQDFDEVANLDDACPQISGLGDTPGENCCDPQEENVCTGTYPNDSSPYICFPQPSGLRFTCLRRGLSSCTQAYATKCHDCDTDRPCVPAGAPTASADCSPFGCDGELVSAFCPVGDDEFCGGATRA